MPLTVITLTARVERLLRNIARKYGNETIGTGDGSRTTFYITYPPVKPDSQTIYIDGVEQDETTHYTFDDGFGRVTFLSAPSASEKITTDYTGLYLEYEEMEDLVEDSVPMMGTYYTQSAFTVSSGAITPTPSDDEATLLALHARLYAVQAETMDLARTGIRTARTGASVDTTSRARALNTLMEMMEDQFKKRANRVQLNIVHRLTIDDLKR